MRAKGRARSGDGLRLRGEQNPQAKVTADQVRQMRAEATTGDSTRVLARRYGISRSTVRRILAGVKWQAVDGNAPVGVLGDQRENIRESLVSPHVGAN
jgi:DNA invertase Pin-like site-specific DNA recombinase